MYDCSKEFNTFYREKVVLSAKEQNELRQKRKLNIRRLKEGLKEYNKEKKTSYKIAEDRIQGSMAMHTITQNDEKDYDIDVGIVFESDCLNKLGAQATRNMVANALERKTRQFAQPPEVKTSCVRLKYSSDGYHMDLAVFQRSKENEWDDEYIYEHAGSEWSERGIKALEEWFIDRVKYSDDDIRKVVRLSKMFCKSRDNWKNMPSGLVQTILCDENLRNNYSRLDEKFYYTMKAIVQRLEIYLNVNAPVDNGRELIIRDIDYKRMENWKNRLRASLNKLDILFDKECSQEDALQAWSLFFNHSYWNELTESTQRRNVIEHSSLKFNNTEQFIDELYPIYEQYNVSIDCYVSGNGFSVMPIEKFFDKHSPQLKKFIPYNFSIRCSLGDTNCPSYDKILWKVRNIGIEAEKRDCIRGQIVDNRGIEIIENSNFEGPHYIECYLIKNDMCIGIGHVDIPIGGI
ncbi:nucleotidyltransferase [Staphylococcus aureus]|uniref:nucleotidyltransferase n=1 Tax=Staphylococcus aureus TaxID=1280 RepID=UPI00202E6AC2|nr:nucleotidyltransferase [Staphylococcus aureus]MCM0344860.1 nucleotidyltransferase [Staphylococcus aureus]MCM0393485.1 nucleotidyltransferase [Staphylococcus aureus]MCM0396037.1 nucleotidyltransferase [Staphylococcus aureus]MCM0398353.1 nucleotidyltransferase [Staphylococcus aureus]MCM0401090.1 nucleotidyltransferase [Staphylococcus aureus]